MHRQYNQWQHPLIQHNLQLLLFSNRLFQKSIMDKAISLLVMVEDIRKYGLVDVGKSVLETCCLWIWKIELRKLDFLFASFVTFLLAKKLLETYEIKIAFSSSYCLQNVLYNMEKLLQKNKKEDENVWAKGKQSTLPFCIFYLSFRTKNTYFDNSVLRCFNSLISSEIYLFIPNLKIQF